ncbi:PorT family protein [Belliella sp. DSM 107340]|uniref:PorT family protein n=1 Tax=Belliella calami TaxID=2923436 RepID=A0ABS9ULU4_9BACT|nr:PorT family protein [Belliella calami]MCH7397591.1 PorT family protein [Belliella calami]
MKEQFDKKLADKIKDSFANHTEPYDPKQWERLSSLYFKPRTKSKPIWGWLATGIAASLVVGLLVFSQFSGLEPIFENELSMSDSVKQDDQERNVSENLAIKKDSTDSVNESLAFSKNNDLHKQPEELSNKGVDDKRFDKKIEEAKSQENLIAQESKQNIQESFPPSIVRKTLGMEFKPEFTFGLPQVAKIDLRNEPERNVAVIPQFDQKNVGILPADQKNAFLADDVENAQQIINNWLAEVKVEEDEKMSPRGGNDKAMRLGVILAPQTISNTTQSMNLGAGVLSEFSFSKRLKLDVGVAYARQTINPSVNNEVRGMNNAQNSSDASRSLSFASNFVNASYELSFGQLEIPLNLKYKLLDNKASDFYLITGVSNMVYMNQKNVGTFTTANFNTAGLMQANQTVQTFSETATPNTVDGGDEMNIGQMLNFSLGYEYSLKNGTFISLEPFYKLSVGGQTFVNQQFAIGGLNLRMNFQLKK